MCRLNRVKVRLRLVIGKMFSVIVNFNNFCVVFSLFNGVAVVLLILSVEVRVKYVILGMVDNKIVVSFRLSYLFMCVVVIVLIMVISIIVFIFR